MLNNADNLINIREAAKLMAVSPTTLYAWASAGRIPYVRLGSRCIRFQISKMLDFINNKSVSEAEKPPKPLTPSQPSRNNNRQGKNSNNKYLDDLLIQAKKDVLDNIQ